MHSNEGVASFINALIKLRSLWNADEFQRYWGGIKRVSKVQGGYFSQNFETIELLKRLFTPAEFDKVWEDIVELIEETGYNAHYILPVLVELKDILTPDNLRTIGIKIANFEPEQSYGNFVYFLNALVGLKGIITSENIEQIGEGLLEVKKLETGMSYYLNRDILNALVGLKEIVTAENIKQIVQALGQVQELGQRSEDENRKEFFAFLPQFKDMFTSDNYNQMISTLIKIIKDPGRKSQEIFSSLVLIKNIITPENLQQRALDLKAVYAVRSISNYEVRYALEDLVESFTQEELEHYWDVFIKILIRNRGLDVVFRGLGALKEIYPLEHINEVAVILEGLSDSGHGRSMMDCLIKLKGIITMDNLKQIVQDLIQIKDKYNDDMVFKALGEMKDIVTTENLNQMGIVLGDLIKTINNTDDARFVVKALNRLRTSPENIKEHGVALSHMVQVARSSSEKESIVGLFFEFKEAGYITDGNFERYAKGIGDIYKFAHPIGKEFALKNLRILRIYFTSEELDHYWDDIVEVFSARRPYADSFLEKIGEFKKLWGAEEFHKDWENIHAVIKPIEDELLEILSELLELRSQLGQEEWSQYKPVVFEILRSSGSGARGVSRILIESIKLWDKNKLSDYLSSIKDIVKADPEHADKILNTLFELKEILVLDSPEKLKQKGLDLVGVADVVGDKTEKVMGAIVKIMHSHEADILKIKWNDLIEIAKSAKESTPEVLEAVDQLQAVMTAEEKDKYWAKTVEIIKNSGVDFVKVLSAATYFKERAPSDIFENVFNALPLVKNNGHYFLAAIAFLFPDTQSLMSYPITRFSIDLMNNLIKLYQHPCSNDATIRHNVPEAIEASLKVISWKQLLAFVDSSDETRTLDSMLLDDNHQPIISKVSAFVDTLDNEHEKKKFWDNVFGQVARDKGVDSNGAISHQVLGYVIDLLNSLGTQGENWKQVLLESDVKDPLFLELRQQLIEEGKYLDSWKQFQRLRVLVNIMKHQDILETISSYLHQGEDGVKLYNYYRYLILHSAMRDFDALKQMILEPEEFLGIGDVHTPEALHSAKKPSRLLEFDHIDLTARELVDGLVLGHLNRFQVIQPFEMELNIADLDPQLQKLQGGKLLRYILDNRYASENEVREATHVYLKKALGQLEQKRQAEGLNRTEERVTLSVGHILQLLEGESVPFLGIVDQMNAFRFTVTSLRDNNLQLLTYKVRIIPKSDPQAVMTGSEAPSCMYFGTGKNNVYLFNPNTAFLALSKKVTGEDGVVRDRILATSVLTLDRKIPVLVSEFVNAVQQALVTGSIETLNMQELLGVDFISQISNDAYISADNVEGAPNEIIGKSGSMDFNDLVKAAYAKFFAEYLKHNPETLRGRRINTEQINVGFGYADFMTDLDRQDNYYVMQAPVGYSDKTGEKVGILPLPFNNVEQVTEENINGIHPLSYEDTLEVAYIENQAFKDSTFKNHLAGLEMEMIAATYNEAIKGERRKNLSLGYFEDGKLLGYAIAYVGVDHDGQEIIYISDLAALKKNSIAGGRVLNKLFENIRSTEEMFQQKYGHYIPVVFQATNNENGSFRLFRAMPGDSREISRKKQKRLEEKGFIVEQETDLGDGRVEVRIGIVAQPATASSDKQGSALTGVSKVRIFALMSALGSRLKNMLTFSSKKKDESMTSDEISQKNIKYAVSLLSSLIIQGQNPRSQEDLTAKRHAEDFLEMWGAKHGYEGPYAYLDPGIDFDFQPRTNMDDLFAAIPSGSKFLGAGLSAFVLESPDGFALRIERGNQPRLNIKGLLQPVETKFIGEYMIEKLPLVSKVSSEELSRAREVLNAELKTQGYKLKPGEDTSDNIGVYEGQYVVIDPGAVMKDQAMLNGGIDLTPANNILQTQSAGEGIKFHLDKAQLAQLQNAPGFVPIIINIRPMRNLRVFLGISD